MTREPGSTESAAEVEVVRRFDALSRDRHWSDETRQRAARAWTESADSRSTAQTVSPEHVAAAVAALVEQAVAEGDRPLVTPVPTGASVRADGPGESRAPLTMTVTELARVIARRALPGGADHA